jgi:hypothetical protein
MPEEKITNIPAWTVADCYSPAERAVLAYTDCLVYDHGRVPDALFDELKSHLSDEAILELTYITTLYFQHAVMSRALRTEFDNRPEPITEVPGPAGATAMAPGPGHQSGHQSDHQSDRQAPPEAVPTESAGSSS